MIKREMETFSAHMKLVIDMNPFSFRRGGYWN